jgi:hypothetical protein
LSLALAVALSSPPTANPPDYIMWGMDNRVSAQVAVLGADMLIGCIKAGIGGDSFWKSCGRGALAGTIVFMGQYVSTFAYKNVPLTFPLVGKLIQDVGISAQDSMMTGDGWGGSFETEVGPFLIGAGKKSGIRISAVSTTALIMSIVRKDYFDWRASLSYGTPVFRMAMNVPRPEYLGTTMGNVIVYVPGGRTNGILSHELVHVSQFSQFRGANDIIRLTMPDNTPRFIAWPLSHITVGQDILMALTASNNDYYWQNPLEVEAYWMQRNRIYEKYEP